MNRHLQTLRVLLILVPIPFIWLHLSSNGTLNALENMAMDLRFRFRGELESPSVKVVYANLDAETFRWLGERPWPKEKFGYLAQIILGFGQAKAVGFDLVFSDEASSELVDERRLLEDRMRFAMITRTHPEIILATAYTQGLRPPMVEAFEDEESVSFAEASHPERPSLIYYLYHGIPQLGLINFDFKRSHGTVARWLPMYLRVEREYPDYQDKLSEVSEFVRVALKRNMGQGRALEEDGIVDYSDSGELLFRYPFEDPFVPSDYYHMSLQLLRVAHGLPPESLSYTPEAITLADGSQELFRVPLEAQQVLEINYFHGWNSPEMRSVSLRQVAEYFPHLESRDEARRVTAEKFFKQFNDAIVLIGPTDPLLQDIAPTPFDPSPIPKVFVHGCVLQQVAEGVYITRLAGWMNVVILLLLTLAVSAAAMKSGKRSMFFKALSVLGILGFVLIALRLFAEYHLVLPLVAPVGSAFSTAFIGVIVKLLSEEQQKSRIQGMFGTYVEPELVNQMIESGHEPELGGEEKEITAFFSDVQSFSAFSEVLTPHQLVELMNEYLTGMAGILKKDGGGAVDKYIGDAIVGIFNAPVPLENHAFRACVASQLMHKEQIRLRDKWKSEGDKWPERVWNMQTRIGLNTGLAVVGNMGSEDRFNYTMMGDTVNLAARMESGSKSYGAYTMVTGETYAACIAVGDRVVFRYLDKIVVKGRSQPVEVYEIVCLREDLDGETETCLAIYQQATERYLEGAFQEALLLYEKSLVLEPNRAEKNPHAPPPPSAVLIQRCRDLIKEPPLGKWDGVFVMKTK